jgi:hypothetical protein
VGPSERSGQILAEVRPSAPSSEANVFVRSNTDALASVMTSARIGEGQYSELLESGRRQYLHLRGQGPIQV